MRPVGHFEVLGLSCFRGHFVLLDCGHCYCSGGRSKVYRTLGQAVCDHKHPPVRAQVQGDWAAISGELKVQRNSGGSLLLARA